MFKTSDLAYISNY